MPTPSPIIVASIGAIDGRSVKPAITPTAGETEHDAAIAVPIGMPAAMTEPKATT